MRAEERRAELIPLPEELPARPRRLIWHWTAGARTASSRDLEHYHYLIEDPPRVVPGVPVPENMGPLSQKPVEIGDPALSYAAHTRNWNSYSVGLALCGMFKAVDRRPEGPVDPGRYPITRKQVELAIALSWQLCATWGLDPSDPDDLTTHWEAEHVHGVDQLPIGPGSWKWDVTWIPGLDLPSHDDYGPWIREQVASYAGGGTVTW